MAFASTLQRLRSSLSKSTGTVVFGMVDGTVSIFGLIFGVAATTSSMPTVVIAGASGGAVAAAVSMMVGAYLDVETTRDALVAKRALAQPDLTRQTGAMAASLPGRLAAAGLTQEQSTTLAGAVQRDPAALCGLFLGLQGRPEAPLNPWEQALWMLLADFMAAAVPILPFVWLPIPQARVVSGAVTLLPPDRTRHRPGAHRKARHVAHRHRNRIDRDRGRAGGRRDWRSGRPGFYRLVAARPGRGRNRATIERSGPWSE